MIRFAQKCYTTILSVFFPLRCQISGDYLPAYPIRHLNTKYYDQLFNSIDAVCTVCGKPAPPHSDTPHLCGDCRHKSEPSIRFISAGHYSGILKKLIHLMKYKHKAFLSDTLGEFLLKFLQFQQIDLSRYNWIIPIPLSPVKIRERGFNQSERISETVSKSFNIPINSCTLFRKNHPFSQTSLNRIERLLNLKDVFYTARNHKLKGKKIILVDDVRSTGSTLYYASECLFHCGVKNILTLTLANNDIL